MNEQELNSLRPGDTIKRDDQYEGEGVKVVVSVDDHYVKAQYKDCKYFDLNGTPTDITKESMTNYTKQ